MTPVAGNRLLLKKLLLIALLMFGFAWALVPLYQVICEVTGINQLVKAEAPTQAGVPGLPVRLTLDANVQAGLPWKVVPLATHVSGRTGEFIRVDYEITNLSNRHVVGQAVPRYLPAAAGPYVQKLDCFCFKEQAFAPGQTRRFPVVLVIDRALPREIGDITLAYSVFDLPGRQPGNGR